MLLRTMIILATDGKSSSVDLLLPLQRNIWSARLLSSQLARYSTKLFSTCINRDEIGDFLVDFIIH